ncbi:MAG TPA: hypothetical protein VEU29_00530 [Actinomycetota bacterium]|nr:hypothetical protein [Actinomycetota bacterium]
MKKALAAAVLAAAVVLPAAPAHADDGALKAGVGICQNWHPGYRGVYVWWYDGNDVYHRTNTCIYVGP